MLRIAFENLSRNKARTMLSVIALVIGVVTIIAMISTADGIKASMTEVISNMNGVIVFEKDALDIPFSRLPENYGKKLEEIPGVRAVFPEVWGFVNTIDGEKPKGSSMMMGLTLLIGLDPVKERARVGSIYGVAVEKGRRFNSGERYVAILGQGIVNDYSKQLGSMIKINGKRFKVIGILEKSTYADYSVVVPIEVAKELTDMDKDTVNSFTVQLYNPQDQERILKLIESKLDDVEVMSSQTISEELEEIMAIFDWAFIILSSIALLIAGVGIINTMLMSVMDRQKEIGVLKAVGWTSEDILKLVLYEAFLIGVFGGVVGCILGSLIVILINQSVDFTLTLTTNTLIGAFVFAVFAGIVGGIYPAWKISKIDPIQAIRME